MEYLGWGYIAAGFGAGICLVGAALGISKLASTALEGTARQPEAAGALRTSMIIPAALIEGLALFALVICFMLVLNLGRATPTAVTAAPAEHAAGH